MGSIDLRVRPWHVVALALLAAACASTGGVPRPFPMPGSASAGTARPSSRVEPTAGADALVAAALRLRGVPYRNGGGDPSGFDCSGFTQYVFAQTGVRLPRDVHDQFQAGSKIPADQLEPGDLVFFSTVSPGPSHVGIAIGGDEFIHAPSSKGAVRVEHLGAGYWSRRFVGIRRVH
jgi:cell wall-associated NlpC family hydrolase